MASEAQLLPCPFCGSHAETVHASHIRCANIYNCDCETRLGPTAWNRRVLDAAAAVDGDALRNAAIEEASAKLNAMGIDQRIEQERLTRKFDSSHHVEPVLAGAKALGIEEARAAIRSLKRG